MCSTTTDNASLYASAQKNVLFFESNIMRDVTAQYSTQHPGGNTRLNIRLNVMSHWTWPSFLPTEIEICVTSPEDGIFASPKKVLVNGKTICFFKLYQSGDTNIALRELENYKRITGSNLDPDVRICRLLRVVKDDESQLIGLLLTYIECDFLTLSCAVEPDTQPSTRQKWVDQNHGHLDAVT